MSDDQDDSQKTEEATPRKLAQAKEKGQTANSKEITNFAILFGGALAVGIVVPFSSAYLAGKMDGFVQNLDRISVDQGGVGDVFYELLMHSMVVVAPVLAIMVVMAIAANLAQTGIIFSASSLEPKLEKISPLSGVKRLFSLKSVVEFLKGLLKLSIVGTAVYLLVVPEFERMDALIGMPIEDMAYEAYVLALQLFIAAVAIMAVIGIADYLYQRYEFLKQMRMSLQDIKDEMKNSEGDPMVKARLRQIRAERARTRMMSAVPDADVVVTNPTHYSVALKYDATDMAAPIVVAKGVDAVAFRIREVANENDVPIVENPPLARALFAACEIDDQIPEEQYKAVAEVISYVFKLKGRVMGLS